METTLVVPGAVIGTTLLDHPKQNVSYGYN